MDMAAQIPGLESSTSLLALIMEGVQRVDLDALANPDYQPEPGMKKLGVLDEQLKRLHGFRAECLDKAKALQEEGVPLAESLMQGISGRQTLATLGRWFSSLFSGESNLENPAERLKVIGQELETLEPLISIAGELLSAEMRRKFHIPSTVSCLHVCDDWSVVTCDDEGDSIGMHAFFGGSGGFEEFLEKALGRRRRG